QIRRLEMELLVARSDRTVESQPSNASIEEHDSSHLSPLLTSQTISARVLGRQAQSFLLTRNMLDVGKAQGATAKALVIDDVTSSTKPLLDQGRDAAIEQDRLVLAGSRVWGKVAEVGLHTCTVQGITDAGYRDLVQLANVRDGRLHFAARGVLKGQGLAL